jgi:hypothetical protein
LNIYEWTKLKFWGKREKRNVVGGEFFFDKMRMGKVRPK